MEPNRRASMSMNDLISARVSARRGPTVGLIDRLRGAAPLNEDRAEKFARLHSDYEAALKRGDEVAAAVADTALDKLFEESRAARASASNIGQPPVEPAAPANFSGGYRGRIPVAPARGMQPPPTSKELFLDAIRASEIENRGRPAQVVRIPGAQR